MAAVDLALVLALDGSASVTYDEFNLMAGGLGAALRDPEIVAGLTGGPRHASLGALLLWSGADAQEVLVDWTAIRSAADAEGFAAAVENIPRIVRPGLTAIGAALLAALKLLGEAPASASRRIVDVAGDGRSNDGPPPGPVRDRMAALAITINGLCVLHEEPDLLQSYTQVIGGPGAFAIACPDYAGFAQAMGQKLAREIAAGSARPYVSPLNRRGARA
jgi:Ca-activated chloride channel homolog